LPGSSSQRVLTSIDPVNANLGTGGTVPLSSASSLKVSAGDELLYVLDNSSLSLQRFNLPALISPVTLTAALSPRFIAPSPDAVLTVAFSGFEPGIVDDNTRRSSLDIEVGAVETLSWGADTATLYGVVNTSGGLSVTLFHVDGTGITGRTPLSGDWNSLEMSFDRTTARLYGGTGENCGAPGGDPRPFTAPALAVPLSNCNLAIDAGAGKAFLPAWRMNT
jgi:hypothetical protein